jgi:hypothetical protein
MAESRAGQLAIPRASLRSTVCAEHWTQCAPTGGGFAQCARVPVEAHQVGRRHTCVQACSEPEADGNDTSKYAVTEVAALDAHNGQVWRVSWNVTGTMLATSGADATVKLWRGACARVRG